MTWINRNLHNFVVQKITNNRVVMTWINRNLHNFVVQKITNNRVVMTWINRNLDFFGIEFFKIKSAGHSSGGVL